MGALDGTLALLADRAADLLTAAAVLVCAALWLRTRSWSPAVPVLLELLLAAGLLRLGSSDSWRTIATAAAIVALRTILKASERAHPSSVRDAGGSDLTGTEAHSG